jgi:WD40 repeat protein
MSGAVNAWDTTTGRRRPSPGPAPWPATTLAFSPVGDLVASGYADGSVVLWAAADGRVVRSVATPNRAVWALAFSADGRSLATGGFGGWTLWDAASGRDLRAVTADAPWPVLAVADDGRRLATAGGAGVTLWDTATGLALVRVPTGPVRALAFARAGTKLVVAESDGTVSSWAADTGRALGAARVPHAIEQIAVAPDRMLLATVPAFGDAPDPGAVTSTRVYLWEARSRS